MGKIASKVDLIKVWKEVVVSYYTVKIRHYPGVTWNRTMTYTQNLHTIGAGEYVTGPQELWNPGRTHPCKVTTGTYQSSVLLPPSAFSTSSQRI
jgi:hypothetical protein